ATSPRGERSVSLPNGAADAPPAGNEESRRARLTLGPFGFLFCFANAALITAAAARWLKGEQSYGDLVAGSLVWTNADKDFDFRVFYSFLGSFGLLLVLLLALGRRFQPGRAMKQTLERGLALSLTPGALWFGTRLATNSPGTVPIECILAGAAAIILLFALSRRSLRLMPEAIGSMFNGCLLGLLFSFFSGLGVATVLGRVGHVQWSAALSAYVATAFCVVAFAAMIVILLRTSAVEQLDRRIGYLLFGSQVFLPLLLAVVVPPVLIVNGARVVPPASIPLMTALTVLAVIGWSALVRRWTRAATDPETLAKRSLVPWTIAPVAVFLSANLNAFPTFSGDDFHLGEHLLPWQQLHDFGKLPFVDFVPVHPLMDLAVGAVNALFFDGTLANYENSRVILFAAAAALTFVTVARFARVDVGLCLALAANLWDRLLLVPALFAMLCYPPLFQRRARWLLCCNVLCVFALFYNPAVGTAMTLASAPFAAFQLWRLFIDDRRAFARLVIGWVVTAGLAALIPAVCAISAGFVQFLIDNGRTVAVAHGLEWRAHTIQMPAVKGTLASPFIWEALRFSWVIVLLVAGCIFVLELRNRRDARPGVLVMSGMCCLFLFCLAGWTLNRIDPFMPSRTGEVSYLACLYILPLMLFAFRQWRAVWVPAFALSIGFFQQGMTGFINSGSKPHFATTTSALLEKTNGVVAMPAEFVAQNGSALGLPNLGHIYATNEQVESIVGLRTGLQTLLRPGETYLDLTNRQAAYFYLGLPTATSYGAPWLTANTALQERLLHEIHLHPPPLVWIAPALVHDTGTPAVRTYKLYRYLANNYVPVSMNGHTFLVEPQRVGDRAATPDEQVRLLQTVFDNPSLGKLPAAWGGSFARLSRLFVPARQLGTRSDGPLADGSALSLDPGGMVSGGDADFIRFDFASNLSPISNMEMEITWVSEYGHGAARFAAANGTNLVPLGAYAAWLRSRAISKIDIVPVAPPQNLRYVLINAQLLRLKD
ncbi:MAG: hypothetical protein ABR514_05185, partial [Chthoniobacterales bacterium]